MTAKIQGLCRDGFEVSLPNMISIAKGEKEDASPGVQVQAHNNLGKWAMAKPPAVILENREWLAIVMGITSEVFPDRDKLIEWTGRVFAALEKKPDPKDD